MKVQINGESRDFDGSLALSSLVVQLGMKADRVAVELNRDIVPRVKWAETQINE
jgi:sulfur carrier protein